MTSRKNLKIFNLIRFGESHPSAAALIIIQTITISETFTAVPRITNGLTHPIHLLTSTAPTPTPPGFLCKDWAATTSLSTLVAAIPEIPLTHQRSKRQTVKHNPKHPLPP